MPKQSAFAIIGIRNLARERKAKRDETVAFRVSEQIAAWLRDRCCARQIKPSALMREILIQHLEDEQGCKRFSMFANLSEPDRKAILRASEIIVIAAIAALNLPGLPDPGPRTIYACCVECRRLRTFKNRAEAELAGWRIGEFDEVLPFRFRNVICPRCLRKSPEGKLP
jgi:hypothetical protein